MNQILKLSKRDFKATIKNASFNQQSLIFLVGMKPLEKLSKEMEKGAKWKL
jgi:hypothetical protein